MVTAGQRPALPGLPASMFGSYSLPDDPGMLRGPVGDRKDAITAAWRGATGESPIHPLQCGQFARRHATASTRGTVDRLLAILLNACTMACAFGPASIYP